MHVTFSLTSTNSGELSQVQLHRPSLTSHQKKSSSPSLTSHQKRWFHTHATYKTTSFLAFPPCTHLALSDCTHITYCTTLGILENIRSEQDSHPLCIPNTLCRAFSLQPISKLVFLKHSHLLLNPLVWISSSSVTHCPVLALLSGYHAIAERELRSFAADTLCCGF